MGKAGLAYYRKVKDLTQADVAKKLGVNSAVMGFLESGDYIPSPEQLDVLVELLGVPPTYLFSEHVLAEIAERARAAAAS